MPRVDAHDQRIVEEGIFRLFRGDSMPLPILQPICIVPFKAGALIQLAIAVDHNASIR